MSDHENIWACTIKHRAQEERAVSGRIFRWLFYDNLCIFIRGVVGLESISNFLKIFCCSLTDPDLDLRSGGSFFWIGVRQAQDRPDQHKYNHANDGKEENFTV